MHQHIRDRLTAQTVDAQTPVLKEAANRTVRLASTMRTEVKALTESILADQSLTARVLAVANSVFYSQRAEPTTSVQRAVLDMGFNAIRNIALAVELVELAQRGAASGPSLPRLLARALLAAHLARGLGTAAAQDRTEDLYTTALLQSFDELALACFLPDDYAEVERLLRNGRAREEACAEVFGATPDTLLPDVLEICGLPRTLAARAPDWTQASRWRERERHDGLAILANDLAWCYVHSALVPAGSVLAKLLARMAGACRMRQDRLEPVLCGAFEEACTVGRCLALEPDCFLPAPPDPADDRAAPAPAPPLFLLFAGLARSEPSPGAPLPLPQAE